MNTILYFSQSRGRVTSTCIFCAVLFFAFSSSIFAENTREERISESFSYVNLGMYQSLDKDHRRLCEKNPDVLALTLSTPKKSYKIGELIPITLKYSNTSDINYSVPGRSYDRSGRFRDINFHVEGPDGGFIDPMATHYYCMSGGLCGEDHELGEYWLGLDLNSWVRFDLPGKYRMYCTSDHVGEYNSKGWDYIGIASTFIELDILPADKKTNKEILKSCKKDLLSRYSQKRQEALRRLVYLGTEDAVKLMLPLLVGSDDDFYFDSYIGMIGSRDRKKTLDLMLKKMADPDVAINSYYINALADLTLAYDEHIKYLDPYLELEDARQARVELREKNELLEHKYMQQLVPLCKAKKGKAYADTCRLLISKDFKVEGAPQELVEKYASAQKRTPRPKSQSDKEIEKLKNFVENEPITELNWSVKSVPEDVALVVKKYKQSYRLIFPYIVEYALNLHLKNLQYTKLARELPVEDNILLSEFVRLADIPKYKTAYEAGWLYSQFDGNFNGKGYSSFQVYVWYMESCNEVNYRFSNAERLKEICRQIEQTGMHGVGGGRVCHYWCR